MLEFFQWSRSAEARLPSFGHSKAGHQHLLLSINHAMAWRESTIMEQICNSDIRYVRYVNWTGQWKLMPFYGKTKLRFVSIRAVNSVDFFKVVFSLSFPNSIQQFDIICSQTSDNAGCLRGTKNWKNISLEHDKWKYNMMMTINPEI